MKKTLTNNNLREQSAATGLSLENGRTTHVPVNGTDLGGGKSQRGFGYDRPDRTPERIAKAQTFHARRKLARQNPANCGRCGNAHEGEFRTCDKCREKVRHAKLRSKGYAVMKDGEFSIADLAGMVLQMRREMDRMQARFKLWQKAAQYRQTLKWRTNTMRKKYLKTFSQSEALEYLAQTNHAYETVDGQ